VLQRLEHLLGIFQENFGGGNGVFNRACNASGSVRSSVLYHGPTRVSGSPSRRGLGALGTI
jgi:hypothetical protein